MLLFSENSQNHCMTDRPSLQAVKSFNSISRSPYELHVKRQTTTKLGEEPPAEPGFFAPCCPSL